MVRFYLSYIFFVLSLMLFFPTASFSVTHTSDVPAADFVRQLGDKALSSLTAKELPEAERAERVRTLLRENFDIQAIGKFVLGTHWKETTDTERNEYFKLFE